MATAPTIPLVPVDEYLSTAYHADKEYIDGVLVERSMPTLFHTLLQGLLSHISGLSKRSTDSRLCWNFVPGP
jgi:Uma2 family endonuclease